MSFYETQKAITAVLTDLVETKTSALHTEYYRKHLGASVIGNPCARAIWYGFRWVKAAKITGKQYRLYQRGHEEEKRLIRWLTAGGCTIIEKDPETGKQFQISDCQGHFGGSTDGKIRLPEVCGFDDVFLLEMKCLNHKYFIPLKNKPMAEVFPKYKAQIDVYGYKLGFDHALFVASNKQDDDLAYEIVEVDKENSQAMLTKAAGIIYSEKAPNRIAKTAKFYLCNMCNYQDVCWFAYSDGVRNCRKCDAAKPVENGEWFCVYHKGVIPKDFILTACDNFKNITYGD